MTKIKLSVFACASEFSPSGINYVLSEPDMFNHFSTSDDYVFVCDVEVPEMTKEQVAKQSCAKLDKELAELNKQVELKQKQLAEINGGA